MFSLLSHRRSLVACIVAIVLAFSVVGCSSPPASVRHAEGRVWIEGVPRGDGKRGDPFGQGIALALTWAGQATDYETVMGDSGIAFVMQASEVAPLLGPDGKKVGVAPKDLGKVVGRRDVGWWPLAGECAPTYVPFVGRAAGRELRMIGTVDWLGAEGMVVRPEKMHGAIVASIDRGRPVVVKDAFWSVAVGYDSDKPSLWSFCPSGGPGTKAGRMGDRPWLAVVLGDKIKPLDRRLADREALRHAVALARDEVKMPNRYLTGQRAYALWARELRQMTPPGQARWHANVVLNLSVRRGAAVIYLEAMSRRREEPTRGPLLRAIQRYKEALGVLRTANTSHKAMTSPAGREALAKLSERLAAIEAKAASQLARAAATIR